MSRHQEAKVWQNALPAACLAAVQADAPALAECPNYWVPRAVVEGQEPAATAAEQVVQHLYRRLAAEQLGPHGADFVGAEYWCQIYEKGRGLGWHVDKDEHVMKEEGRMVTPIFSSVFYASGSKDDPARQAPTVLSEQWFNREEGCLEPETPAWSAMVFPEANQYLLFDGSQAHGVLEAMPQELAAATRTAFLVNWWAQQPQTVVRATAEDVQAARLAGPKDELQLAVGDNGDDRGSGGGGEDAGAGPQRVQFVSVGAPALEEGDVLPVDELLEACGVRLTGAGAADAVVIRHPGLSLYPLDEEQVDPAHPLQVLAALLPTEEEESSSSSSEEE